MEVADLGTESAVQNFHQEGIFAGDKTTSPLWAQFGNHGELGEGGQRSSCSSIWSRLCVPLIYKVYGLNRIISAASPVYRWRAQQQPSPLRQPGPRDPRAPQAQTSSQSAASLAEGFVGWIQTHPTEELPQAFYLSPPLTSPQGAPCDHPFFLSSNVNNNNNRKRLPW